MRVSDSINTGLGPREFNSRTSRESTELWSNDHQKCLGFEVFLILKTSYVLGFYGLRVSSCLVASALHKLIVNQGTRIHRKITINEARRVSPTAIWRLYDVTPHHVTRRLLAGPSTENHRKSSQMIPWGAMSALWEPIDSKHLTESLWRF